MAAEQEPAVAVEGLVVVRGGTRALDGLDLAVRRGAVTGLLGPNGSGKTTLMRCVVGTQRVSAGRVRVLGLPAGATPLRSRIGYLTQSPSVYADLTVRENLRYFASVLGVPRARVDRAIATVALTDIAGRLAGKLSGGQRARVSLAVALLGEPELLVLDEPTVGLDPLLRRLRPAGAAARRQAAGDRHARRHPGPHRSRPPGGRLPAPDRAGAGRQGRCPVSPRITLATAVRVLTQLRHDPRTILLLLGVPCLLVTILHELLPAPFFDRYGGVALGLFPFIVMFVITAVATLRERVSGTLERLLAMPPRKLDLLLGYAIAFGVVALVQAAIVSWLALGPLDLDVAGGAVPLLGVAILDGLLGMALGLFVSAFAATEFQAAQFMPAFVLPQVLLSGLFGPRETMTPWLRHVSDVLPLTYAVDAMQRVSATPDLTATIWRDLAILAGCCTLALLLGAATLRRRTA